MAYKAEENTLVWLNDDGTIYVLPKLLQDSIFFKLPFDIDPEKSNFTITTNTSSCVYIGYISWEGFARKGDTASFGWSEQKVIDKLKGMGFELLNDIVKIRRPSKSWGICTLTLLRKFLNQDTLEFLLEKTDIQISSLVIFVQEGNN